MDEVRVYNREVDYSTLNQIGGSMNEDNCCGAVTEAPRSEALRSEAPRNTRSIPDAPTLQAPTAKEIVIRPLNHGYVITVGCQSFAIENAFKLSGLLLAYLRDPVEVEKAWMTNNKESKFFPRLTEEK